MNIKMLINTYTHAHCEYICRRDVDNLNTKELGALPGDMIEYRAMDSGDQSYLRILQTHCPARSLLKLKVGAQVILVKNIDAANGLVNGAKGVVVRFTR
jgi:ATP-dependent DNA helicase PIF1